ncbi:MAG: ABC transporter permease [Candidatus Sumerlaeota bacterium]|nr:ABC transporter permease [Candidatus Sumerlaeota bacterium]
MSEPSQSRKDSSDGKNRSSHRLSSSELTDFSPGRQRFRQALTIINLSVRRYLFTRYMGVLIFLGLTPCLFAGMIAIAKIIQEGYGRQPQISEMNQFLQMAFRLIYIHFIIFFVAIIFGFTLLRKEVDDRTLHYLFLQPVSKTLVILSKYVAFVIVTWIFLCATFLLMYVIMFIPYGIGVMAKDLFESGRAVSLVEECFVMLVALALYGAIFMVMGTLFKSAWFGAIFYLWETALPYLPSTFKFFTVSNYLQAMTPERGAIAPQLFELYGEMPGPLHCVIAIVLILTVFISLTVFLIRRYECRYAES